MTVYLGSAFEQSGRKVLVIYTDGDDTSSSRRWDETLRLLRASDVTVYPMGFLSNRGSARLMLQSKLMEIARLTGGRAVFPGSMKELDPMYSSIADEIHGQYVLGYVPDERRARRQVAKGRDQAETAAVGARADADAGRVLCASEVTSC